jgi:hypothetical protein
MLLQRGLHLLLGKQPFERRLSGPGISASLAKTDAATMLIRLLFIFLFLNTKRHKADQKPNLLRIFVLLPVNSRLLDSF